MKLSNVMGVTALSLLLAACGGQEPPRETVVRAAPRQAALAETAPVAPAAGPSALRIGYVEYLPAGDGATAPRRYQAVQLMLELEPADAKLPVLELQAAGRPLGRVALARHGASHWRATIPAAWTVNGLSWRAVAANHGASAPYLVPLAD